VCGCVHRWVGVCATGGDDRAKRRTEQCQGWGSNAQIKTRLIGCAKVQRRAAERRTVQSRNGERASGPCAEHHVQAAKSHRYPKFTSFCHLISIPSLANKCMWQRERPVTVDDLSTTDTMHIELWACRRPDKFANYGAMRSLPRDEIRGRKCYLQLEQEKADSEAQLLGPHFLQGLLSIHKCAT